MSELRLEWLTMPAGRMGAENPLPPLHPLQKPGGMPKFDQSVPEEARRYVGYGFDSGLLPYQLQDDYDAQRQPRTFRVAVLENQTLRATFLLELGGRLWSLIHKPSGRELLYVNPVFQPRNLAVRNAWFSGGVEWNAAVPGHTPFTCAPLFAAVGKAHDGSPRLRLYEWERMRGVPYQIDAWLPDASPVLFVRVGLRNPHRTVTPMYWWSNIAVAEAEDVRTVVPADGAFNFGYQGSMRRVEIPRHEGGADTTYATNSEGAADWFFDIPAGQRPWIAALDGQGRGLVQTSTARLRGRKMFVWGMNAGGRRWQDFLSLPGQRYLEIQAGLGRTQAECLPMPPESEWSWLEAYGLMDADPKVVHGADWGAAWGHVEARLERLLPRECLEREYERGAATAAAPAGEVVQRGSGWGALERRRQKPAGAESPPDLPPNSPPDSSRETGAALEFDDASLGPEQAPWLALLERGELPYRKREEAPGAWMVQPAWRALLEAAVAAGRGRHWLAYLHLGVMRYRAKDMDGARQAWEQSAALEPSGWALRNLAVLAQERGEDSAAADLYEQARALLPEVWQLAIEFAQAALAAKRPEALLEVWPSLPAAVRAQPRLGLLHARAQLDCGDSVAVAQFLDRVTEVTTIREGEVSLSDLWFALHEKRLAKERGVAVDEALRAEVREKFPPPAHLDFRAGAKAKAK